jgi:hypothetical protein
MKNQLVSLLIALFCFACGNPSGKADQANDQDTSMVVQKKTPTANNGTSSKQSKVATDSVSTKQLIDKSIVTKATILSVREELIMPSDYLTTAMTVKTVSNDTLVFLDMFGFEELVNQEITIQYKLTSGTKLLVCFDCNSYSKEIQLHDITSMPSDVVFETLRFKEYVQDPYIVPASTFRMIKEDGRIEEFYSNDNDLVSDSIKMATSFHSYGIVTKLFPELENREELVQMLK